MKTKPCCTLPFGRALLTAITLLTTTCLGETLIGWGYGLAAPPKLTNVIAIAAGYSHSLALLSDGTVVGWGTYRTPQDPTGVPMTFPAGLTNVIAISSGDAHDLALRADGTVTAWGLNPFGQLDVPLDLTNVVAIAAAGQHSFALKADGTVLGWGTWGGYDISIPPGLTNVVSIGAGGYGGTGGVALKDDGSVVTWGRWLWTTQVPSYVTNIVAVAGSAFGYLALRADGTVLDSGGEGTNILSGLTDFVALSGSSGSDGHVNLALKSDGTVVGWGYDRFTGPTPAGLSNVVAIAAGGYHNLALVGTAPPIPQVPVQSMAFGADGYKLSLPTRSGHTYRLEYTESLTGNRWSAAPLVAGTSKVETLSDTGLSGSQRFYRVRQW